MIQQLYCGHCTFGSSALEQRQGELADRPLGYGPRAASLSGPALEACYRHCERVLSYYPAADTPAAARLALTVADAPRQLFLRPGVGNWQVLGQIVYAPKDATGKPASGYFAHVLCREVENGQPPWSLRDGLRLWGSPKWMIEDAPSMPFVLPVLASLQELRATAPAINDKVLLSFLTTPAGQPFHDPGQVIPPRWRSVAPAQRRGLLHDALAAFLGLEGKRREPLLLVVEPSLAALLFYGMVHLLPEGGCTAGLGFSTYEPNPDRLTVPLAATVFHDPARTDVRPEVYRRGFVLNTFLGKRSEDRPSKGRYAATLVALLVREGPAAVDRLLRSLEAAKPRLEDLEELLRAHLAVDQLLDPSVAQPDWDWHGSELASSYLYLRQALAERLAEQADVQPLLARLVGSPAHLRIVELLAHEPALPGTAEALEYLVHNLPHDRAEAFLRLPGIAATHQITVLARHLEDQLRLPGEWEQWRHGPGPKTGTHGATVESLYARVLARLDAPVLGKLCRKTPPKSLSWFLTNLAEACTLDAAKPAVLEAVLSQLPEDHLEEVLDVHGRTLLEHCPPGLPLVGPRLNRWLERLPEPMTAVERDRRLETLLALKGFLPRPSADQVGAWHDLQVALDAAGVWLAQKRTSWGGLFSRGRAGEQDLAAESLGRAFQRALQGRAAAATPDDQLELLARLAREREAGLEAFLSEPVRNKLKNLFTSGNWVEDPNATPAVPPPEAAPTMTPATKRITQKPDAPAKVRLAPLKPDAPAKGRLAPLKPDALAKDLAGASGLGADQGLQSNDGSPRAPRVRGMVFGVAGVLLAVVGVAGALLWPRIRGSAPTSLGEALAASQTSKGPDEAPPLQPSKEPPPTNPSSGGASGSKTAPKPGPTSAPAPRAKPPKGPPALKLDVAPRLVARAGEAAAFPFRVDCANLDDAVTVDCEYLPIGVTVREVTLPPAGGTGELRFALAAEAAVATDRSINVVARSGSRRDREAVRLTVLPCVRLSLTLPNTLLLHPGLPYRSSFQIARVEFDDDVVLHFTGLPEGVMAEDVRIVRLLSKGLAVFTVRAAAPETDVEVTILATAGPREFKLTRRLVVLPNAEGIKARERALEIFKAFLNLYPNAPATVAMAEMLEGLEKTPRESAVLRDWESGVRKRLRQGAMNGGDRTRLEQALESLQKREFSKLAGRPEPQGLFSSNSRSESAALLARQRCDYLVKKFPGTAVAKSAKELAEKLSRLEK